MLIMLNKRGGGLGWNLGDEEDNDDNDRYL